MHLHPLLGAQRPVVIGVGAVEVLERDLGHLLQRDPAVMVGVGHLEHLAVHAHAHAHAHSVHAHDLHARHARHSWHSWHSWRSVDVDIASIATHDDHAALLNL